MTQLHAFYRPEVQREYENKPYPLSTVLHPSPNTSRRPSSLPAGVRWLLGILISLAIALWACGWLWEVAAI